MRGRTCLIMWAFGCSGFAAAVPAADHTVTAMPNLTFSPPMLTIEAGDTVTFVNGGGFHNATADDGSFRCADGCDGQGGNGDPSTSAWSATVAFPDPGDVPYHCEIHGGVGGVGMSGVISVQADIIFADGFESAP